MECLRWKLLFNFEFNTKTWLFAASYLKNHLVIRLHPYLFVCEAAHYFIISFTYCCKWHAPIQTVWGHYISEQLHILWTSHTSVTNLWVYCWNLQYFQSHNFQMYIIQGIGPYWLKETRNSPEKKRSLDITPDIRKAHDDIAVDLTIDQMLEKTVSWEL